MRTITKQDFPLWFKILVPIVCICISLAAYNAKDCKCSLPVDTPQTKVKRKWNDCLEVCTDSEYQCRRDCWGDGTCKAKCIITMNSCMSLCDQTWSPRYDKIAAPAGSTQQGSNNDH
jgi:hypothetical protein